MRGLGAERDRRLTLARLARESLADLPRELREIDVLELELQAPRGQQRHVEQSLNEQLEPMPLPLQHADVVSDGREVVSALAQRVQRAVRGERDGGQRRAQLV